MTLDFDVGKDPVNQEQTTQSEAILASSSNLLKLFVSLIQSVWAIITIYRSRGDQIQQYGYAAFGLTVAPYASMSILNALANMLTPDYPSMFLIRTPEMDKVEADGEGFFKGAIRVRLQDISPADTQGGRIGRAPASNLMYLFSPIVFEERPQTVLFISFLFSLIPLGIVGGLSGFQQGNSSQVERGFTMSWLVLGIVYGIQSGATDFASLTGQGERTWAWGAFYYTYLVCTVGAPAIGGMVVVGMMIRSFGICTLIG